MLAITALLLILLLSLQLLARRGSLAERVLVIGTGPLAQQIVAEMNGAGRLRHRIVGVVDDVGLDGGPLAALLAGPVAELGSIMADLRPDRIVIALTDRRGRLPMKDLLTARVTGVAVEDAVECYERLTGKIAIESLTPGALIASRGFRRMRVDLTVGHALCLFASIAALIVFAPLLAAIALAVKIDSPGPVFFVHDRAGLGGRRIRLLKFRTMRPSAGPTSEWEKDNTDRITRIGRWLRKYRLDELPQLINVLRGDLNLVGPRPHPISNVDLFGREIPYYSLRAVVRPGLTGWAQVRQGYANGLLEETEKMRYDLYYIKHMSAWLDCRILIQTIGTVFGGRTAVAAGARAPQRVPSRLTVGALRP